MNVLKAQQVVIRHAQTPPVTTRVPVTMDMFSAVLIATSALVSTWCALNVLHCNEQCSKGFACSMQMLTSAPLVMVAVSTTVTTLLAPTTATVVLGTQWTVMVATVMVSGVV